MNRSRAVAKMTDNVDAVLSSPGLITETVRAAQRLRVEAAHKRVEIAMRRAEREHRANKVTEACERELRVALMAFHVESSTYLGLGER